ncbi:MAG TPA: FkbM family methyltransferase [Methanomicrobiales archaeon]|nr:FkbM family methyltransferase [Methanomicrobiales archaeon]
MWPELRRRLGRTLSVYRRRKDPSRVGETSVGFVDPATMPVVPVADKGTIRFVERHLPYRQIHDVGEYRFDDIRREDVVVDIGANAGAFCIRAARYSDHVTAVEPVSWEVLQENIRLNRAPVKIIVGALGDGNPGEVSWDGFRATVQTYTLRQIIGMAGGCDFLKSDCEGAEWCIRPDDLEGIRRIEMELHIPPIGDPPNSALLEYIGRHYDFEIDRTPGHDVMGVMGILHATRS